MKARIFLSFVIFSFLFGLFVLPANADKGPFTFSVEVPVTKWKAMRLKNLPKDAVVGVKIETSGEVGVSFLDSTDYLLFPKPVRPVFQGRVQKKISFSVTIPDSGHYYVVFFNDSGAEPRAVKVTVRAARGAQKNLAAAQERLQKFERRLNRIFIFETFSISVKECGEAKAFTGPTGIVLCKEYVQKLYETLKKNKAKASDAALFTVLHEVGHVFLKQWDYPFFDNEEIADEFATAIMVMFGQKERVRAKAEFFSANPSLLEALAKLRRDDRHPLSKQRARNILRWSKDPQLVRKWQKIFVPHMQTAFLERLKKKAPPWTDLPLIEKELAARR